MHAPRRLDRSHALLIAAALAASCTKDEGRGAGQGKPAPAAKTDPSEPRTEAHPMPGPRPPHRGMADPHGASKAKPKGPPRDVTPSGEVKEETLDELKVSVPVEWEKGHPRSTMRLAEFTLPGPGGDAELVVYRFEGGAGDVEANIERWKGQFEPPEGKSMDELTKVEKRTHAELEITVMDVSGRYVAAVRPGAAAQHDEADYRMLTAIVEGSGDPFFFKAVGPKKTLDVWAEAYETMLASMKTG